MLYVAVVTSPTLFPSSSVYNEAIVNVVMVVMVLSVAALVFVALVTSPIHFPSSSVNNKAKLIESFPVSIPFLFNFLFICQNSGEPLILIFILILILFPSRPASDETFRVQRNTARNRLSLCHLNLHLHHHIHLNRHRSPSPASVEVKIVFIQK